MGSESAINLLTTNDLHFRKKGVCGTDIASNKLVKNMSMFDRSPITCNKNVLDYLATRQKVVASNVANINTPGYKTRDVSFDSVLRSKHNDLQLRLSRTHDKHFKKVGEDDGLVDTFYAYGPVHKSDGRNDVDIDKEMLKVGEIQTNFNIFSQFLMRKYHSVRNVISGSVGG